MEAQVSIPLSHELQRRFKYITNLDHCNFDAHFITSTFLSPGLRDALTVEQKEAATNNIIRTCGETTNSDPELSELVIEVHVAETTKKASEDDGNSPSPKRFKHLCVLLAEKQKQETNHRISEVENELDHYVCSHYQQSMEDDPFEFWLQNMSTFLNLASFKTL
jgi:hypothetical protein